MQHKTVMRTHYIFAFKIKKLLLFQIMLRFPDKKHTPYRRIIRIVTATSQVHSIFS